VRHSVSILLLTIAMALACGGDASDQPVVGSVGSTEDATAAGAAADTPKAPPTLAALPAADSSPEQLSAPSETGSLEDGCSPGIEKTSYKGRSLSVTICPNVPMMISSDDYEEPCDDCPTLWVGATARSADNSRHIDLEAVEIKSEDRGKPVVLKGSVKNAIEISWGVWAQKVEQSEGRYGAEKFGYVLAGPLEESAFRDLAKPRIAVMVAGGDAFVQDTVRKAVCGGKTPCIDGGEAKGKRDFVEVLYKGVNDRSLAESLGAKLDEAGVRRVVVTHWAGSPERITVAIGS